MAERHEGEAAKILATRLYPRMVNLPNADRCLITCERRAFSLLSRTFPELDFIPVAKAR